MEKSSKLSKEKQATLDSLLSQLPSTEFVEIDLPAAPLYSLDEPVMLRPMTWEDEKALVSGNHKDPLKFLLRSCLKGIVADDLTLVDRKYVLFKLRQLTFGPKLETNITCPACGAANEVEVDFSAFENTNIPPTFKNQRTVKLPYGGLEVEITHMGSGPHSKSAEVIMDNLWRYVKKVADVEDQVIIAQFIKKLAAPDVQFLMREVTLAGYGLDTKFLYACPDCKAETLMEVPLGSDFFSLRL